MRLFTMLDEGNNLHSRIAKVTEFSVKSKQEIRADIVLLVNGIPLVVIETKTPVRPSISWLDGAMQISEDYEKSVPEFFV
ncbi:MAG: hypothetical protein HN996_07235, partial [Opitutae bacterium]|nr:hypothetical protein [Opitutae bacterium]